MSSSSTFGPAVSPLFKAPKNEGVHNPNPSFDCGYNPNLSFRRGYNPNPNFHLGPGFRGRTQRGPPHAARAAVRREGRREDHHTIWFYK